MSTAAPLWWPCPSQPGTAEPPSRVLPRGALFKPRLIEVAAVAVAGGSPHPVLSVKVWVGFLDAGLENSFVEVDSPGERPFLAASSQVPAVPDLDGLIAAADNLFQFTSAASAPEAAANSRGQATPRAWEERMGSMERALSDIQVSLSQLTAPRLGGRGGSFSQRAPSWPRPSGSQACFRSGPGDSRCLGHLGRHHPAYEPARCKDRTRSARRAGTLTLLVELRLGQTLCRRARRITKRPLWRAKVLLSSRPSCS